MGRHFFRFRLLGTGMLLAMLAVFSVVVMLLWNVLMPEIFGLPALNYGQALGLTVLARILFSGLGGGLGRRGEERFFDRPQGNALREKWMKMGDEERKEFMRAHRGFSRFRDCFDGDEKPGEKEGGNE